MEMPPKRRGRAECGGAGASTQRRERQQSDAEAGPVQDGDGGHDLLGSRFRLVYYERARDGGIGIDGSMLPLCSSGADRPKDISAPLQQLILLKTPDIHKFHPKNALPVK